MEIIEKRHNSFVLMLDAGISKGTGCFRGWGVSHACTVSIGRYQVKSGLVGLVSFEVGRFSNYIYCERDGFLIVFVLLEPTQVAFAFE